MSAPIATTYPSNLPNVSGVSTKRTSLASIGATANYRRVQGGAGNTGMGECGKNFAKLKTLAVDQCLGIGMFEY